MVGKIKGDSIGDWSGCGLIKSEEAYLKLGYSGNGYKFCTRSSAIVPASHQLFSKLSTFINDNISRGDTCTYKCEKVLYYVRSIFVQNYPDNPHKTCWQ